MGNFTAYKAGDNLAFETVPDGQERLATQSERDDVNDRIEHLKLKSADNAVRPILFTSNRRGLQLMTEANILMINRSMTHVNKDPVVLALATFPVDITDTPPVAEPPSTARRGVEPALGPQRQAGDQVNGFLLCSLVSKSAKRLQARARKSGIQVPMTITTRCVLRAYQLAAKNHSGPFSGASADIEALGNMDGKILKDVLKCCPKAKASDRTAVRRGD